MKILAIYSHLLFLFFPVFILSTHTVCGTLCMSCYNNLPALVAYALPSATMATAVTGFFFLPALLRLNGNRKFRNRWIENFLWGRGLWEKIYTIDSAKPVAFSFRGFRSAIFISMGMQEILNKRELEAVILHEIAHIRQHSSMLKISNFVFRIFSPFYIIAGFHHENKREEMEADNFAMKIQGTRKYIKSSKKKVSDFYNHK
ncbi:MAG: M48 family metalloprotease [Candidatus Aenigmarchaeota archaeon]|nr:M48 family metalloprotease [Candidatus Aenigmarchaeota archaeon]